MFVVYSIFHVLSFFMSQLQSKKSIYKIFMISSRQYIALICAVAFIVLFSVCMYINIH